MAKGNEELLAEVGTKVARLAEMYGNCREANAMLTQGIQDIKARLDDKEARCRAIEARFAALQAARSLGETPEATFDAKRKIGEIVREIDQCIALLRQP